MVGIVKNLLFAEGVIVTPPSNISTSVDSLMSFASDAAYVSDKGSAAVDGDLYYNTTVDRVKVYANSAWVEVGADLASLVVDGDVGIGAGDLVIGTSGKGIDFSANTGLAGESSSLLDWYEEGTWTPTVTASTGTLTTVSSVSGVYTRIGRKYFCDFAFTITTNGTGSARLRITLPATSAGSVFGIARERTVFGFTIICSVPTGTNTYVEMVKSSNDLYPGGDGYVISGQFSYFV